MDSIFKTQDSSHTEAKNVDNNLQKIQALMLNTVAPLLELQEISESDEQEKELRELQR